MLSFNLCFVSINRSLYCPIGPMLRSESQLPLKSMGESNVLWQGLSKPFLGSTGQLSTKSTKIDKIDQDRHSIFTLNIDIKYCYPTWLPIQFYYLLRLNHVSIHLLQ